jgi:hypothetical protein
MKKLIYSILLISLFPLGCFADCDWKTGITQGPNNTFVYTEACHQEVGKLVKANKDLTSAIQLKDLALTNADARTALWQKSADDEMDRLNKMSADRKMNDWLFFGLGALTVIGSGFMAARLIGH